MVTSVNPSSLRVSWDPPPEIDHNGVIIGYVIEYTRVETSDIMIETVTYETSYYLSVLVPFVVYSVRVAAITVNGTGPFSDAVVQTSGQDSKFSIYVSIKIFFLSCIFIQYPAYQYH